MNGAVPDSGKEKAGACLLALVASAFLAQAALAREPAPQASVAPGRSKAAPGLSDSGSLSSAAASAAAVQVFHSPGDDGLAGASIAPGSGRSVYLYIDGGSAPSTPGSACADGQGDEICGYDLELTGVNGVTLVGFTPDAGADLLLHLVGDTLRVNGLDTAAPGTGPQRIGELVVDASPGGSLDLETGEVVRADLASEPLPQGTVVAVPEPGRVATLLSGVALLRVLARRRRRAGRGSSRVGAAWPSWLALLLFAHAPAPADAARLIVNEWNAVSGGGFLNGGTLETDGDGNSVDPPGDTFFGRVAGNGGDWIELVVVGDHLDIRGWSIEICENGSCNDTLVFSNHAVWSDLRAGTILTVAEDQPTDLSFALGSDWWMNVQAQDGGDGTYITASNFPVNELDWNATIRDADGNHVFGPLGEHVPQDPASGCFPPQDDVNAGEIFRLEQAPSAIVDPCFPSLNDWEDGVISTFGAPNQWNGGLAVQSFAHLRALAPFPDRDGDGIPDDGDLSGVAGDNPCVGGNTGGCDDNCPALQNPLQEDVGGPDGPDGMGDICQCGDPTGDSDVTAADLQELRELRVGLRSDLTAPERCSVHSNGQCTLADLVVLDRALGDAGLEPGLAPRCQAAAVPPDMSDIIFDPDRLLRVEIRIALADWDVLRFQENDIFALLGSPTCGDAPWNDPYTFFHAEVTVDGETLADVGVRKKGFQGSLSETEPSLKVKFDHFVGGQQIGGMDRFTLNNNKQDPAHVKQCLGYGLLRKAGIPAPRCNFAHLTVTTIDGMDEVTVVDDIFTHVESIKDPFLRRNFGSDQGRLYEGALSDFWAGPFRGTIAPKTPAAAADTTEVDALMNVLMDEGLPDADRLAAIEGLVDVDAYLTFWAGEGMIGHWDGYADDQNNFWFYVDPADGLIRFIPWGADDTFGRGNTLPLRAGDPVHAEAIVPRAALPRRLYEIASSKALYLARLQLLMDAFYDEAELLAEIDRMEAIVTPVTGDLTAELDAIRTWVNAHRASVQAEIDAPPAGFADQPVHFCDLL